MLSETEITDLLAPNDQESSTLLGTRKGAKGDHKGAHSATTPCKHTPKALVLVETSADSHTNDQIRNPVAKAAKGAKARKRTTRDIDAKKCGVITNPPHWARSCPEAVSAQVVSTSPPLSSASETAASGLPVPVNNGAEALLVCADKLRKRVNSDCNRGLRDVSPSSVSTAQPEVKNGYFFEDVQMVVEFERTKPRTL